MRRLIQFVFLCVLLLFGVFLGIDKAERNIQAIQGITEVEQAVPVDVESLKETGEAVEPSPDGTQKEDGVSAENKIKTVVPAGEGEAVKSAHFLSHLGNKAGEGLKWATRKTVERLLELTAKLTP